MAVKTIVRLIVQIVVFSIGIAIKLIALLYTRNLLTAATRELPACYAFWFAYPSAGSGGSRIASGP